MGELLTWGRVRAEQAEGKRCPGCGSTARDGRPVVNASAPYGSAERYCQHPWHEGRPGLRGGA